jgi:hypothetical protein
MQYPTKTTLIIGASTKPNRYAYKAALLLQEKNIPVEAVGRQNDTLNYITIHKDLKTFKDIHTITLYVNPKVQDKYEDYIIQLQPKRVIFNPGTENPKLQSRLKQHGITYENACTLVLLKTGQY